MKRKFKQLIILIVLFVFGFIHINYAQEMDLLAPFPSEDCVFIEDLTWIEVRDALKSGKTTVIVSTGGIEQNGPFVVTGKHNYVLKATTEAIARKLGNALVAPIIMFVPEGTIEPPSGHMNYPGTISLRDETFKLLLIDICSSLKQHGFSDIVLIGDSGGNQQGMKEVSEILNKNWGGISSYVHYIPEYYEKDMWSFDYLKTIDVFQIPDVKSANRSGVHSDYHYEAILATVDPILIRTRQRIATGMYSVNGFEMSSHRMTSANGEKLIKYRTEITVNAIIKAINSKRTYGSPRVTIKLQQ